MAQRTKERDNRPAINSLRQLGYVMVDILDGIRDGILVQRPDKKRIRVKIQKRNGAERAPGQHWIGVCHLQFQNVDAFVFWIRGQSQLLLIPCDRLETIFNECERTNTFTENERRWHVVFHFMGDERVLLEPQGSGTRYEVTNFALNIPVTNQII